jgi:hypothetical protein
MKLISENELWQRAANALRDCLERVPFLGIADTNRQLKAVDWGAGMAVNIVNTNSLEETMLMVAIRNNGQPRYARDAINALSRYNAPYRNAYGVLMAPYIAVESAAICKREGTGYVDFAGNCRLAFGGVYIEQAGNPNPFPQKRDLRKLFSAKAERVIRVLLNNPVKTWKILAIASEAGVSTGEAYNVKTALLDREWCTSSAVGFKVSNWEALLDSWTDNYSARRKDMKEYYSMKSLAELESDLAVTCQQLSVQCALAGFSGAARMMPMVKYSKATAFIGDLQDTIANALNLKEVASGGNIALCVPYDKEVFYNSRIIDGVNIVSPIQLYLDLKNNPGRGEEAADTLYKEVIRPAWLQNETTPQKL